MRHLAFLFLLVSAGAAASDTVVAARNIRPGNVLLPSDLTVVDGHVPGGFSQTDPLVGMESKVTLYVGRPILSEHIGEPAVVERNQHVILVYESAGLSIQTEGRALGRGSEGDRIRVMNLDSKSSLFGVVLPDGSVRVAQ